MFITLCRKRMKSRRFLPWRVWTNVLFCVLAVLAAQLVFSFQTTVEFSQQQKFSRTAGTAEPAAGGVRSRPALGSSSKIPRRLVFTYKWDILKWKEPKHIYHNIEHTVQAYQKVWNWTSSDDAMVSFLDDETCREDINATQPGLIQFFNQEQDGSFKADICRISHLYLHGGYYSDIDMEVIQPFVAPDTASFVTVRGYPFFEYEVFFQSFLASEPRNPILRQSLDNMLRYYTDLTETVETALAGGGSKALVGPITLQAAFQQIPEKERGSVILLDEAHLTDTKHRSAYKNVPRQNGKGDHCNYIVHNADEQQVYFYSRMIGSGASCDFPTQKK